MSPSGRPYPEIFDELVIAWAKADPAITRAWIFGSYSRGEAHAGSDLDVAVEIDPNAAWKIGLFQYWRMQEERMEEELRRAFSKIFPALEVNIEHYHRHWGSIIYGAICRSSLAPVYRRPRSERLLDTDRAEHHLQS